MCDDLSDKFYVARFTREKKEVKAELWDLKPGQFLQGEAPNLSYTPD